MPCMVSLAMERKAERRLRQLLNEDGFSQPDEVEYGPSSVTLFWHSVKKSVTVDVTERGEVGQSRAGPPSPKWETHDSPGDDNIFRLPTLGEKRSAEQAARAMLDEQGLPPPDHVEYGFTCIRLFWMEQKVVLIVDLIDPPPGGAAGEQMPEEELERRAS